MSDIPDWLKPFLQAGVLLDTAFQPEKSVHTPPKLALGPPRWSNAANSRPGRLLGETDSADSSSIPSSIIAPPNSFEPPSKPQIKAKRSALLKAYAHSIRGLMTPDNDLSVTKQALFIANPLQKGIPVGVQQEFINEAIFQHSNSIQSPLSPIYRSGVGDYFGWLNKYLSNVNDVSTMRSSKAMET